MIGADQSPSDAGRDIRRRYGQGGPRLHPRQRQHCKPPPGPSPPSSDIPDARSRAQIFTNPDMLHLTILPREESWRRFFQNLRFVVVDELHTYAGLFGSHVAFVMRR